MSAIIDKFRRKQRGLAPSQAELPADVAGAQEFLNLCGSYAKAVRSLDVARGDHVAAAGALAATLERRDVAATAGDLTFTAEAGDFGDLKAKSTKVPNHVIIGRIDEEISRLERAAEVASNAQTLASIVATRALDQVVAHLGDAASCEQLLNYDTDVTGRALAEAASAWARADGEYRLAYGEAHPARTTRSISDLFRDRNQAETPIEATARQALETASEAKRRAEAAVGEAQERERLVARVMAAAIAAERAAHEKERNYR